MVVGFIHFLLHRPTLDVERFYFISFDYRKAQVVGLPNGKFTTG
jgi:hypothetical protein